MKDQSSKMAVLQKIIDMMDGLDAKKLKKPDATIIDIKAEGSPEEEALESPDQEAAEKAAAENEDEDDPELMAKLHAMYSKVK